MGKLYVTALGYPEQPCGHFLKCVVNSVIRRQPGPDRFDDERDVLVHLSPNVDAGAHHVVEQRRGDCSGRFVNVDYPQALDVGSDQFEGLRRSVALAPRENDDVLVIAQASLPVLVEDSLRVWSNCYTPEPQCGRGCSRRQWL